MALATGIIAAIVDLGEGIGKSGIKPPTPKAKAVAFQVKSNRFN
jgi:hypothetical protein